jgi:hypothetical protein
MKSAGPEPSSSPGRARGRRRRAVGVLLSGTIAGLSGTLAMTAVAGLERALSGRRGTSRAGRVAARALRLQMSEPAAARLGRVIHWTYGGMLGVPAALMRQAGVPVQAAVVLHMAMAWLPWRRALKRAMVNGARDLPPAREIALDAAAHAVYVGVTWLVLSRITMSRRKQSGGGRSSERDGARR